MNPDRRSGVLAPLFALTSSDSWGVGEFLDLPVFAAWLTSAGQSIVQILPITEIPDLETSPYSALTAMALDPIYISVPALEDFQASGGDSQLTDDDRALLGRLRAATKVEHRLVRPFKARWLRRAHERFREHEIGRGTPRAEFFASFIRNEASWLDDYALFMAIRRQQGLRPWWEWPEPLARRHESALAQARADLRADIEFRQYVQWAAADQWSEARRRSRPLQIFGDLPFMISADSPDVWTRQAEFVLDASVGVPPDAFSETGQNWGLPPWRWEVMAANDFAWMRQRATRSARLFDGFRLDHLVGLYRTYIRPFDTPDAVAFTPYFAPADEDEQRRLGERIVRIYQSSGAEIVAEDLGTVPDFVRASLKTLGVPGLKVFRWERQWWVDGHPFVDPPDYAETSVATTGTHDTEPLASWWDVLPEAERRLILGIPAVARYLGEPAGSDALVAEPAFGPDLNVAFVRALLDAGSRCTIFPVQDLFGWRDRINVPARVDDDNWTWRLPWRVDRLDGIPEARAKADELAGWTRAANRVDQP